MADLEKTIDIIFGAVDNTSNTITGISSNLNSLGGKAASATQPLADLASSAVALEAALVGLVATGLVVAVSQAGEFADSFAEISTLIEPTGDSVLSFRDDILEYSRGSTAALDDINGAIYTAISAGTDYKDALGLLTTAETLSVAGKADLESVTNLLASTMNAYGAETKDAGQFSDAFFQAVKLGQTTIPLLASSMSEITPIAAQMQVPIETLTAAVASLTFSGVPTSQAITQIKGALVALAAPSKQASDLAASLGVNIGAAAIESEGFETVLGNVFDATGGNIDQLKILAGRVEALNAILVLGGDENGKFADTLVAMRDAAGSTEEAFEKMSDNLNLSVQTLKNNIKATLIDFGLPLLDESTAVVSGVTEIFQAASFAFHEGAFDPIFDLLESLGVELADTLSTLADNLPEALSMIDWSGLIDSIQTLRGEVGDVFSAFFDDVDLSSPEGLASAIQLVVDAGSALTNIVGGIIDAWTPFIAAIGDGIQAFANTDDAAQTFIGNIGGWAGVINTVSSNIGILTGGISSIGLGMNLLAVTRIPAMITGFSSLLVPLAAIALPAAAITAAFAALGADTTVGAWLRENVPLFNTFAEKVDAVVLALGFYDTSAQDAMEKQALHTQAMADAKLKAVALIEQLNEFPEEKATGVLVEGTEEYEEAFDEILEQIKSIPAEKETEVKAAVDTASVENAERIVLDILPDGTTVLVDTKINEATLKETKEKVDEVPTEKQIEIKLQGEIDTEIARINAQAETIQNAFEWSAKMDIAEVEANAEIITTLAEGWASAFESTGEVITGALGALTGAEGLDALRIEDIIRAEQANRDIILANETELTDAQVAYMNARTEAMQRGQGLVTIQAEGLEPELELVLHRIIELTQIRANEEGLELLLGV